MKNDIIAGLIGTVLLSCFLLGLAGSIGQSPFWVIVILVLSGAWIAWYQDALKSREVND